MDELFNALGSGVDVLVPCFSRFFDNSHSRLQNMNVVLFFMSKSLLIRGNLTLGSSSATATTLLICQLACTVLKYMWESQYSLYAGATCLLPLTHVTALFALCTRKVRFLALPPPTCFCSLAQYQTTTFPDCLSSLCSHEGISVPSQCIRYCITIFVPSPIVSR